MKTAADLTIGKLRISNAAGDATVLRSRLERWMGTLETKPPGVPPAAVLIVRRLPDPLPRGFDPARSTVRVDGAWERAVRARLADLYRGAARPLRGPVAANAEAVVFADIAEMLACLAIDLIRGGASGHWWWQGFWTRPGRNRIDILAGSLLEHAEHLPAVLHHLSEQHLSEAVVDAFDTVQARALLTAVSRAFALPDPPGLLASRSPGHPEPLSDTALAARAASGSRGADAPKFSTQSTSIQTRPAGRGNGGDSAPWAGWYRGSSHRAPDFSPEKACLLGVGLGLYHAPATVRGSRFQADLREWLAEIHSPSDIFAANPEPSEAPMPSREGQAPKPVPPESAAPRRESAMPPRSAAREAPVLPAAEPPARPAVDETGPPPATAVSAIIGAGSLASLAAANEAPVAGVPEKTGTAGATPPPEAPKPAAPLEAAPGPRPEPPWETADEPPPTPPAVAAEAGGGSSKAGAIGTPEIPETVPDQGFMDLAAGADTCLGGAFYLINLMAKLELPGCFEDDWSLATGLGPWGLLDLLSRAFLEECENSAMDDPLWRILAALAGRDPEVLPGATLRAPDEFRLPANWPLLDAADLAWAITGGRLWLWLEHGPLLAETRLGAEPAERLALALAESYVAGGSLRRGSPGEIPLATPRGALLAGLAAAPLRWLERTLPYLNFRLRRGLGHGADTRGLAEVLLRYPARVYVSSAHVDIVMSLRDVSLALRVAGLDRDPGWLPEFGRVVSFHFE